jgi:LysM repeat protein
LETNTTEEKPIQKPSLRWHTWLSWVVTAVLVAVLVSVLYWQPILARELDEMNGNGTTITVEPMADVSAGALANMPYFDVTVEDDFLLRKAETHTIAPTKPRYEPVEYTVVSGDAIFSIAKKYNISPETLLWANYDVLADDPHSLRPDQILVIPPTSGILYEWKDGDTIESVAAAYSADPDDILSWFGNNLDLTNPEFEPGQMVMVPGGEREFQNWASPPVAAVGRAGVYKNIEGGCVVESGGYVGGGFFIWPADNHYLSGNDFWSGHLAIDIAAATGMPIYAADAGVVVFSGWYSSYGNMVMIDHQTGFQTVYAHLNSLSVSCGTSVYQGQVIGQAGSTGNSTGPHLHFEIRYLGGYVNPWEYLP